MTKHILNVNLALVFDTAKEQGAVSDQIVAIVDGLAVTVKEKSLVVKSKAEEETVRKVTDGTRVQVYPVPEEK